MATKGEKERDHDLSTKGRRGEKGKEPEDSSLGGKRKLYLQMKPDTRDGDKIGRKRVSKAKKQGKVGARNH